MQLLPASTEVTLEFSGTEGPEVCLQRYRDNLGRLLVWLHVGDEDFQESMISAGIASTSTTLATPTSSAITGAIWRPRRQAPRAHVGVWNQVEVNGSEQRNYAMLGVWWAFRAELIDDYREERLRGRELVNSRLDYARLHELASESRDAMVFTELRAYTPVGQKAAIVDIGSRAQLFKLAHQPHERLVEPPRDREWCRRHHGPAAPPTRHFLSAVRRITPFFFPASRSML